MFSMESRKKIIDAINDETENAKKLWGSSFNSVHEGWAILKEEIEEATQESKFMQNNLDYMWDEIRRNEDVNDVLAQIYDRALNCAMECLQVAAVVNKIKGGVICS